MIRCAEPSDCQNLAALSILVWQDTYAIDGIRSENSEYVLSNFTEELFARRLKNPSYKLLVFIEGNYLRGYVSVNLDSFYKSETHGFEIERLYVHNRFEKRGIGKALISAVRERFGDKFWLYSWENNQSLDFYYHLGFVKLGTQELKLNSGTVTNVVLAHK